MARDIFSSRNQCRYCGRPGVTAWDPDLLSCRHEICESLAFADLQRRRRHRGSAFPVALSEVDRSRSTRFPRYGRGRKRRTVA